MSPVGPFTQRFTETVPQQDHRVKTGSTARMEVQQEQRHRDALHSWRGLVDPT